MQNLLQHVKSLKTKKIANFKQELQAIEKKELGELEAQVHSLRATLDRLMLAQATQKKSKKEFSEQLHTRFEVESYKQELLRLFWDDVLSTYFKDSKKQEAWLESQLETVSGLAGVIRAGESYVQLKALLKKKQFAKISLEKSEALKNEAGFEFESETNTVDARFSTFAESLFDEHKMVLYKVSFG